MLARPKSRVRWTLAALLLACAPSPTEPFFETAGDYELELEFESRERRARVHLPPGFAAGPLPVVLSFHGGGGRALSHQEWTGLDALADRERFAVVYPDGTGRFRRFLLTFNGGNCCGYARAQDVDDVGFAIALLHHLSRKFSIDRTRVYATGMSNGAMMSYRLAAEAAERIAAIAPVAAAMSLESFAPARSIPVLHIHSVDDPRALYEGGLGPPFPLTRSRVLHRSVEGELQRWARHNGCSEEAAVVERREAPAGRFDAGHTATRLRWTGCRGGAEVALWKLTGAGHVWPGPRESPVPRLLGPSTQVIDANREIWSFFRRFQRLDAPPLSR